MEEERSCTTGQAKILRIVGAGMSKPKNSLKILLTENGCGNDTPFAPVSAFPPKNVPAFLSNPHAGNTVSEEHRCLHN
jgi:hypothetical protein